jgi:BMFP domain-containing protein YqiC
LVSRRRIARFDADSGLAFSPVLRYQTRMNDNSIEALAKKLADSLPGGLRTVREDLEQNFRSILQGGLSRLDLVTREEFEVQEAVLARTREKLEALEKQVAEMEASSD